MDGAGGVTSMAASTAAPTESGTEPVIPSRVAEMVVAPGATPVASPGDPASFEMVATEGLELDQATLAVRSWLLPSPKVPVAVNGCWVPGATVAPDGDTWRETSAAPPALALTYTVVVAA